MTQYLTLGQEPVIAPGVRGCVIEHEGELHIPIVSAEHPGTGAVAAFLDSLPQNKRVVFPTVVSYRLADMLLRRGFVERRQHGGFALETLRGGPKGVPVVYTNEPLTCFVREAAAAGFAALERAP